MTAQLRRSLIIGLAFLAGCTAQDAPPEEAAPPPQSILQRLDTPASRVLAVPKWVGVLKARSRTSGQWTTPYTSHQWKDDLTYLAPIEISMLEGSNFGLSTIKRGFYNFSRTGQDIFQGQTISTQVARCSDSALARTAFIEFPTDSSYKMQLTPFTGLPCKGTVTQYGTTTDTEFAWYTLSPIQFGSHFVFDLPAVDAPLRIHGTKHLITSDSTVLANIPDPIPYGMTPVEWDIEWDLRPESDDLDLVLSAENYNDWLPLANIEPVVGTSLASGAQRPGSTIRLKAEGIPKPGSTSTPKLKQVTFYLKSSKEPGIAMNALDGSPTPDGNDLQFEKEKNELLGLDFIDIETVESPEGNYTEVKAIVSSFDFGGYGEVVAWGVTEDGKGVVSVSEDQRDPDEPPDEPTDEPLRLPKRSLNSNIATLWKAQKDSLEKSDLDDSETLGGGRGDVNKPGDGLSHYEEYRGFILNNDHTRTNPKGVDYFLSNKMGPKATPGINFFEELTNIKVHRVGDYDFESPSRVINPFYTKATHVTNQHVVIMYEVPGEKGTSNTLPGPGNPKSVSRIEIARGTPADGLKTAVAHELAHSVNVPHHGEWGFFVAAWEELGNSQFREAPKYPTGLTQGMVDAYLETPSLAPVEDPDENLPRFLISTKCREDGTQSVFSGAHNCIMRYKAEVKIHTEFPNLLHKRAVLTDEKYGTTLCATTAGTDFNAPPNPRHIGPAAEGRGDCIHKIVVSDRYDLKPWTRAPTCDPIRSYGSLPPRVQLQADTEQ
ncbi:hypothetical protein [Corallococcus exiguus]|uniref:hypothetical protein n=1 Tax=Corallococcus exiguus TaxID=83462 RepID=UPI003DA570D5